MLDRGFNAINLLRKPCKPMSNKPRYVQEPVSTLIQRYLHLTRSVMPLLAQSSHRSWPVHQDHCFQRIVLDNVCNGVWYDHIAQPAYKHLTQADAKRAIELCEDIIDGRADLQTLNRNSLSWRGKL